MSAESTRAWAAFCTKGEPHPFINEHAVRAYRRDVMKRVGEMHATGQQTWHEGWKRAYRRGWRAVRVTITMESTNG